MLYTSTNESVRNLEGEKIERASSRSTSLSLFLTLIIPLPRALHSSAPSTPDPCSISPTCHRPTQAHSAFIVPDQIQVVSSCLILSQHCFASQSLLPYKSLNARHSTAFFYVDPHFSRLTSYTVHDYTNPSRSSSTRFPTQSIAEPARFSGNFWCT